MGPLALSVRIQTSRNIRKECIVRSRQRTQYCSEGNVKKGKYVRYLRKVNTVLGVSVLQGWNAVKANKVTADLSKVSCQTEEPGKHVARKLKGTPLGSTARSIKCKH